MPLHKVGQGLLELFRLRTLGRNPDEFSTTVVPVSEVADFYGADLLASVNENGAAGVISATLASVASANVRRYITLNGVMIVGAAAGTYLSLNIGYRLPATTVIVHLASMTQAPVAIGGVYRVSANVRGLVLPPGHQIVLEANGDAAGADHLPSIRYGFNLLDGR